MDMNTMADQRWKLWIPSVFLRQIPTYIPTHNQKNKRGALMIDLNLF